MMANCELALPAYGWQPRPYQRPAWGALESGIKRLALAWPRRAGKDELGLHWSACEAMQRIGVYWYLLPQHNQARKVIWDGVDAHTGRRRIDNAFPAEIIADRREQDMFIRFVNGSTFQLVGSDNYDALMGSPPVGIVFSEYALSDPTAWGFLRPILAENGGWAIFISTPRGRNHFARLVEFAKTDPEWFGEVLTVEDTKHIPMDVIARERRELTAERGEKEAEAIVQQEYYCDFDAAIPGTYYGELMANAEREGRIGVYPYLPNERVGTAWDLGIGDSTVVWFYQQLRNGRVRLIDVLEGSGVGLDWYAKRLSEKPYTYADHIWPHDGDNSELGTGATRKDTARRLGIRARVLARDAVDDGIQATRQLLPLCEFNTEPLPFPHETRDQARERMRRALDAIRQYRREWDEKLQRFRDKPLHDWSSHTTDALRYLALGRKPFVSQEWVRSLPRYAETEYNMFSD
jgi:phage terminase large subunit